MNTFEMYSNMNTLDFLQKYSNTNTFKNVFKYFEYEYILSRPGRKLIFGRDIGWGLE